MAHPNFYENLEEAHRRLLNTVVSYDGDPMHVMAITNHKADGIFRMYLWPVQHPVRDFQAKGEYPRWNDFGAGSADQGAYLDKFMTEHPTGPTLRKHANSPLFNKYRPFPLGMLNNPGARAVYLERSPERRTYQGLIKSMVDAHYVSVDMDKRPSRYDGTLGGPEFFDCVKGNYPSAAECLENLRDPQVENSSVGFTRNFAFTRGPMDTIFLVHKTEVVGFVPATQRPELELGKKFSYLKETVEETRQFADIRVRA